MNATEPQVCGEEPPVVAGVPPVGATVGVAVGPAVSAGAGSVCVVGGDGMPVSVCGAVASVVAEALGAVLAAVGLDEDPPQPTSAMQAIAATAAADLDEVRRSGLMRPCTLAARPAETRFFSGRSARARAGCAA